MKRFKTLFFLLLAAQLAVLAPSLRAADTNDMYRESIKLYEKGDYDKALKGFLKVMRMDPSNAEAREYMLRCSQKIVETKLGSQTADIVEQEIDAEKQVQELSPDAPPALSEEYLTPILPEAPAAAMPAAPAADAAAGTAASTASMEQDIRAAAAALPPVNARDLLSERNALTDDLRRRYLGKGNIIDVAEAGGNLDVTFYMNRLFLPLSDSLRPESYAVLNDIARLVQANPKRTVTFVSVDNVSPAIRNTMADLSVRRTNVVFSYLLHTSFADASFLPAVH